MKTFESNKLTELAVEASPNGMIMVDLTGAMILVNSATEQMFGYSREELLGKSIEILVPSRFKSAHPKMRMNYYAQAESRRMGEGRELYALHKNKKEFPIEIGLNPIETPQGCYVLAAIVDITHKKRAQAMMKLAVEASPSGMILTNSKGEIVLLNSMTEQLFGYHRDELIGQSITLLVPEQFKKIHPTLREIYFKNPKARSMGRGRDLYGKRKDGTEIAVEIGLNPIETNDGKMILASIVDITHRKSQENKILEALAEKEVMLAEIHHRVKNNLQIIDSLLGLQTESISDVSALEALAECKNRVKSMSIIHQTLYESKNFSAVDFSIVVEVLTNNILRSHYAFAERVKIKSTLESIELPIDISIPLGLVINEIMTNIVKHAFKPTQAGEINISLGKSKTNQVTLEISDNGIGFPNGFDIDAIESMGLILIQSLAEQIDAQLTIGHSKPTKFTLAFFI